MQVPCKILQNHNCLMPSDVSKYMYLIIWRYCQWQALLRHWQKVLAPHVDGIDCKKGIQIIISIFPAFQGMEKMECKAVGANSWRKRESSSHLYTQKM